MAPILVFLVAITVLAELAEVANIFDIAAVESARLARGRTGTLFLFIAAVATATTVLLGLDTTAVLLTPVVLSLAIHLDLPPMPFALLTVWLANTASLLLPVSNLTNLLALDSLGLELDEFAARMWPIDRRVGGTHRAARCARPEACCGCGSPCRRAGYRRPGVGGGLGGGLPRPRAGAAAGRRPDGGRDRGSGRPGGDVRRTPARRGALLLVPWRLAVLGGLALVVETVLRHGGDRVASALAGGGTGAADLLQVAGAGAVANNLLNNLPAYLVLEPHAVGGGDERLARALLGTNIGPMVLRVGVGGDFCRCA